MAKPTYHHGDLRRALLQAADEAITENGVAALSMRDLARRAGVSHAAPTHHFGDKAGLLTAFATEGYAQLGKALGTSRLASNSLLELGVTYVRFATTRRAMFEVMFRPDLYHAADPELVAARTRAGDALYAAVAELPDSTVPSSGAAVREAGLAAWSMAHGFATLWLTGAFPDRDADPAEVARTLFVQLNPAYGRSVD
jgi:AcrR family transcriptional regulator